MLICRYARLILKEYLRLRSTVSVTGNLDIYPAHTDAQSFIAVSVTIIVSNLVLHVICLIIKTSEAVAYTLIMRFTIFLWTIFHFSLFISQMHGHISK